MSSSPSSEVDAAIGQVWDGYRIDSLIGSGGMGQVYRATETQLDRPVALKVIRASPAGGHARAQDRFQREAKIIARLKHPNTLRLYKYGTAPTGAPYLVIELLEGRPLDEVLKKGPLSVEKTLLVLNQTAASLAEAHGQGIVHRDIKPANIFLEEIDGRPFVKVLDFGIAGLREDPSEAERNLTRTGTVLGTPAYIAPEVAYGDKGDARADLYALGVVAYECLVGKRPFAGASPLQVLSRLLTEPPEPLLFVDPHLPPALAAVVERLLAKFPDDRFDSAEALLSHLAELDLSAPNPAEMTVSLTWPRNVEARGEGPSPPDALPSPSEPASPTGSSGGSEGVDPASPDLMPEGLDFRSPIDPSVGPKEFDFSAPIDPTSAQTLPDVVAGPFPVVPDASFFEHVPASLPGRDGVARFLGASFSRCTPVAGRILRLFEPRLEVSESVAAFVLFLQTERSDLNTQTFVAQARPLEAQLKGLDAEGLKLALVVSEAAELGVGIRRSIAEYRKNLDTIVVPLFLPDLARAEREGQAQALLLRRLRDLHRRPNLFEGERHYDRTRTFGLHEPINRLTEALVRDERLIVVSGLPGSGKSTVVRLTENDFAGRVFVRVPCLEIGQDHPAEALEAICKALSGESSLTESDRDPPVDAMVSVIETARAARKASASKETMILILEDADRLIGWLQGEDTPQGRFATRLWQALSQIAREGRLALIVTASNGYLLADRALGRVRRSWADDVRVVGVDRMSDAGLLQMLEALGIEMFVSFTPEARAAIVHASGGNVRVCRRLAGEVVRRAVEGAASPLEEVRIDAGRVSAAVEDLAWVGATFQYDFTYALSFLDEKVLQLVAKHRPRSRLALRAALGREHPGRAVFASLEGLRKMGFIRRIDKRERVSIPLLELWARRLDPVEEDLRLERARRTWLVAAGLAVSLVLLGGYWAFGKDATLGPVPVDGCKVWVHHPARAAHGASKEVCVVAACAPGHGPGPIGMFAAGGTVATIDRAPGGAARLPSCPEDSLQCCVFVRLKSPSPGTDRYGLELHAGGGRHAFQIADDLLARLFGGFDSAVELASMLPAFLAVLLAFWSQVLGTVRRMGRALDFRRSGVG